MAKRKYVKENNLVKAINTDSLELQKPLINEYYDINVHNSNMDKIDTGYRQNKNDILNINNDLSKAENTKYSTENGVKEFSCKNGYVDNVYMGGETLVNLVNPENIIYEDGVRFFNPIVYATPNTLYTIINLSNKVIGYTGGGLPNDAIGPNSSKAFNTNNTIIYGEMIIYGHKEFGWEETEEDKTVLKQSVIILEGDHTNKPISYFEGLKSVGQGDKIEVVSYQENQEVELRFSYFKANANLNDGEFVLTDSTTNAGSPFLYVDGGKVRLSRNGHILLYDKNFRFIRSIVHADTNAFDINDASYIRLWYADYDVEFIAYHTPYLDKKQISTTLRSLPNGVKDTIEKRGNKYVKVQRCKEILIDGSSYRIGTAKTNTIDHCIPISDIKMGTVGEKNLYCDVVNAIEGTTDWAAKDFEFIAVDTTKKYIIISLLKTKVSEQSQELFKEYVSSNPITVVYELETPIITELPNFNPQTYSDTTTLLLNTGAIQAECEFEVTNSKGSEIEVLKDKVSNVEEFLINNKYNYQKHQLTQDNGLTINIAGRDLNTILTTMIASGNNMKNAPTGDWYYFEILKHSSNSTMQIATRVTTTGSGVSGQRFIRTTENGGTTWSTWKEFTTTSTIALEEQVLALQEENQALKEELTQIQTSIASLISLITATLEEK